MHPFAMPNIRIIEDLEASSRDAILAALRSYNRGANPVFFAVRDLPANAPRPLNVVATNGAGEVLGGLIGETQFAWCKIEFVAVCESARRKGLGRQIMAAAEAEARSRGCKYAFLDTMDYQAPVFYQKVGYRVAGTLDNWDSHGHRKYFLVKDL